MGSKHELEMPIQFLLLKAVGKRNPGNFDIVFENASEEENIFLYLMIRSGKHSFAIQVASNALQTLIDQLLSLFPNSERVIPSVTLVDNGSGLLKV